MLVKLLFAAWLLSAPLLATASEYVDVEQRLSSEQLHATGLDTLSPTQLKRLNQLLREEAVKVAQAGRAEQQVGDEPSREASSLVGFNDEPIHSRLKGSVAGWEPGTEFVLENGQTWKVLKGNMKLRKPFESPEILVIPGIAGRWFLQVNEDLPKARVYRID
ncbi:MAG: hypothetical protein ABIP44_06925 [Pseudoxanthomonas sp.]